MKIIDRPTYIDIDNYKILINKLVDMISKYPSVVSIFQVGSIKNPGISDLDLLCIFDKNSKNKINVRSILSSEENQILTHNIFALDHNFLDNWLLFNELSNYRILFERKKTINKEDIQHLSDELKNQIALEYMIKMYISLNIQLKYGIIKLRSFLLEAKAIQFDLELLNIDSGNLYNSVLDVIFLRNEWFKSNFDDDSLIKLIIKFYDNLESSLIQLLNEKEFSLPLNEVMLSKNIIISKGANLRSHHKGIVFPNFLYFLGKRYFNLQNRFNSFRYHIKFSEPKKESIIYERFLLNKKIVQKQFREFSTFYTASIKFKNVL